MADLELTRAKGDRRLYALDGVGTLRVSGLLSRSAIAEADGRRWHLAVHGILRRTIEAVDERGGVVGSFEGRSIRRGGALHWDGRTYVLRTAARVARALRAGARRPRARAARRQGLGQAARPRHGRRPVGDRAGLLLFAAYVVRALAEDAGSTAAAGQLRGGGRKLESSLTQVNVLRRSPQFALESRGP